MYCQPRDPAAGRITGGSVRPAAILSAGASRDARQKRRPCVIPTRPLVDRCEIAKRTGGVRRARQSMPSSMPGGMSTLMPVGMWTRARRVSSECVRLWKILRGLAPSQAFHSESRDFKSDGFSHAQGAGVEATTRAYSPTGDRCYSVLSITL
jgi:hypothetical protein